MEKPHHAAQCPEGLANLLSCSLRHSDVQQPIRLAPQTLQLCERRRRVEIIIHGLVKTPMQPCHGLPQITITGTMGVRELGETPIQSVEAVQRSFGFMQALV